MADSTVMDINKMKVVELRKELKSRGLSYAGDKAELVARLHAAMFQDEPGDINLDSDEIDSDGVLEDEDDKSQTDILEDSAVDTFHDEELALADHSSPEKPPPETKPTRILKRKMTTESSKGKDTKPNDNKDGAKKIVLNRAVSVTSTPIEQSEEKVESTPINELTETGKVKITADLDPKSRLELRAKRFGLPVKMSDDERKEARKQRFGGQTTTGTATAPQTLVKTGQSGTLSENFDKLKQRAQRFGQSVSKIMTDIENKEKLEKRKAKFGTLAQ